MIQSAARSSSPRGPADRQVRTVVHELAHALGLHYGGTGRRRTEVFVNYITYIVCAFVGSISARSIPYITGWGEDGALDAIRDYAQTIDAIARVSRTRSTADPTRRPPGDSGAGEQIAA